MSLRGALQPPMQGSSSDGTELREFVPRHRPLIPVLTGSALGIAIDGVLEPAFLVWVILGCAVLVLTLWGALRGLKPWGNWVLVAVLLVPIGGAWHCRRFRERPPWHLSNLLTEDTWRCYVRGTVTQEPELHFSAPAFHSAGAGAPQFSLCRVEVNALSADGRKWFRAEGGLAVFGGSGRRDLFAGDKVQFAGKVRRDRSATNPGETDFQAIYDRQGTHGVANVLSASAFQLRHRPRWYSSVRVAVGRLRRHVKDELIWSADAPIHGITAALIFGQRGRLGPRLSELLSEGGAFHFLAISGLHVGIFAAFVWAVLSWLRLAVRLRAPILILMIWLYALFTGLHVSAMRAAFMLSIIVAAPLFERRHDSISALIGAALLILLFWPQQLFTAGFQLSFLAVWAVIYLYPELARLFWPWDELVLSMQQPSQRTFFGDLSFYARRYLLLSACVWLAVAPVTAYHFHHFSFLTPLINLVLWPLVLLLILSSFLLMVSALMGGLLPGVLVWVTGFFCLRIETLLEVASELPGFVVHTGGHPIWWVGLFYLVLAVWVLRVRLRGGRAVFLAGVLALGAAHVLIGISARRSDELTVTVADVGRGQCVVFRLPSGAVMIYDAGAHRPSRVGAVEGILRHNRARRIQKLVISHRDFDHSSFVARLARKFPIGEVLIPPNTSSLAQVPIDSEIQTRGLRRQVCIEGVKLVGEGLECAVIHPNDRFLGQWTLRENEKPLVRTLSENEKSLVLLCRFGHFAVLLTGDIEEHSLRRVVDDYGEDLKADVLLLPHHGAWAEGLRELIELVQPQIAVASCEGKVDDRVSQVLEELGVPLWTTAEHGAVIMKVGADELSVSGFRSGRRKRLKPADLSGLGQQ